MRELRTGLVLGPILCASIVSAVAAGVSGCFTTITLGTACELGGCDTSAACSAFVQPLINEPVKSTRSPGDRAKAAEFDAVCLKSFTVEDPGGHCVVQAECQSVIDGTQAHGGVCSEPAPL